MFRISTDSDSIQINCSVFSAGACKQPARVYWQLHVSSERSRSSLFEKFMLKLVNLQHALRVDRAQWKGTDMAPKQSNKRNVRQASSCQTLIQLAREFRHVADYSRSIAAYSNSSSSIERIFASSSIIPS